MAADSSCCRRISGGRGPSGDRSPTSGEDTTGSSANKTKEKRCRINSLEAPQQRYVSSESALYAKIDNSRMVFQSSVHANVLVPLDLGQGYFKPFLTTMVLHR